LTKAPSGKARKIHGISQGKIEVVGYFNENKRRIDNGKFIIVNNYLMFSPKIGNVSKTRPSIVEKFLSFVNKMASWISALATIIASGNFNLVLRRNLIVSSRTESVK